MYEKEYQRLLEAAQSFGETYGCILDVSDEHDFYHHLWYVCDCCHRKQGATLYDCEATKYETFETEYVKLCSECVQILEFGYLDWQVGYGQYIRKNKKATEGNNGTIHI